MYGILDISTSALVAQRTRLNVISANLAGEQAILNSDNEYDPFRRRIAVLAAGNSQTGSSEGVEVREIIQDQSPLTPKYDPDSPYADTQGMVYYPNVNPIVEQINAMEASRSYEANITAIETTKSMISVALEMLA